MSRRPLVALAALLIITGLLAAPAGAQESDVYLVGAEPWTESDCVGDVPIVVGSDAKAQSDIYSAVTLAGVLGTDCVVLAGPREAAMPAAQRARLDAAAAGGYVLGGVAAVPEAKIAGRDMARLGGATRWATAQVIGNEARTLAGGAEPDSSAAPDTALTAPADVAQPGVFLGGAEPWIASNCAGDVPVVVGSDAKAQSDIYSAVTLAGVVGTDCVILAGPRDGPVPASQRARFDVAASGGFVLGGAAAVPTAKLAGRNMTRLGGATRWETAQLVGRHARGDTTAGTSTTTETAAQQPADGTLRLAAVSVSAGRWHSCGLRDDGTVTCWGHNDFGQTADPLGTFAAVSAGGEHSCGLRTDGTVTCWGDNRNRQTGVLLGTFTAVSAGGTHSCALRADGTVACWGAEYRDFGQADAPSGVFTAVSAGGAHSCGLRSDGTVACWGRNSYQQTRAPSGAFTAVSAGGKHSCGLRVDGTVACWGSNLAGTDPRTVWCVRCGVRRGGAFVRFAPRRGGCLLGHRHTRADRRATGDLHRGVRRRRPFLRAARGRCRDLLGARPVHPDSSAVGRVCCGVRRRHPYVRAAPQRRGGLLGCRTRLWAG